MLIKFFPIIFALLALSNAFKAESFIKKLNKRELLSSKIASKTLDSLFRKRRNVEESNEIITEDNDSLLKSIMELAWKNEKFENLFGNILEDFAEPDTNLTLIGWQRVQDARGNIKEIQSIQLVIPPKPSTNIVTNIVEVDDDDDDDEEDSVLPTSVIKEMRELLEPLTELGVHGSVTAEEFNKDGELTTILYLDDNKLYGKSEEFAVFNTTSIATPQEVADFIKNLKPGALGKPSVLKYDVDGKLIEEQSKIRPYLLGMVNENDDSPDDIILSGPQIIADISSKFPKKEIPKQLSFHYNRVYPEYKWNVVVNPNDFYIVRDIHIVLNYDNFNLDEESQDSYFVYGLKRKVTQ